MAQITWGAPGAKEYETGVDRCVLYLPSATGVYDTGYAWNGVVSVTESPSGAEPNKQYADNGVYLNILSTEEIAATIEAYTFPKEFAVCDGTATPAPGLYVGQQLRTPFALCYRTRIGNDIKGSAAGYKLHMLYSALAKPTQKAYKTINNSPEASTFSWELSTTPVEVGSSLTPSALLTVVSTEVAPEKLATLESALYGGSGSTAPKLPTPAEIITMLKTA